MKFDILVAEIGSTTTVINGFNYDKTGKIEYVGQGIAPTSVIEGDVTIGLKGAIDSLKKSLSEDTIEYVKLFATSSAAGGLKMTVHGLVYDMTVKAAKEAALGAGANIHYITAGKLRDRDIEKIKEIAPNIILLAGGVDYGEKDTALYNATVLSELEINIPIIYAGNAEIQEEIKEIFSRKNQHRNLFVVENVYPRIDNLNVEPTRKVIQDVFEKHIIHAPGMDRIREMVNGKIIPTPGAVMEATKLLKDLLGDVLTIDVGGATTDVHSVTDGSENINISVITPEPTAKRTVEGDLGVYINRDNIVSLIGIENLANFLDMPICDTERLIKEYKPIPSSEVDIEILKSLTEKAMVVSILRHAGGYRTMYTGSGKKLIAEGKDLTGIKYIVGTGGAFSFLSNSKEILSKLGKIRLVDKLLPSDAVKILIDRQYIMASVGVISIEYPKEALELMLKSFGLKQEEFNESKGYNKQEKITEEL